MSMKNLKPADYQFHHKTKTRWKDLDAFQHINNAVFLSYFEDARIALFERWDLQPNGKSLIVAKVVVNYYKQLLHPSDFVIGQKVSRVGNTSFDIQSTMFNAHNEIISDAVITCVCFDFDNQTTQPVYDLIKNDFVD
tara:strand:- start:1056 stop:1466 length:411 start_codon:yes stop_codon:yes gene_type:complete